MGQVARQLPQMFVRLAPSLSPSQLPDHRLHHFSSQVKDHQSNIQHLIVEVSFRCCLVTMGI